MKKKILLSRKIDDGAKRKIQKSVCCQAAKNRSTSSTPTFASTAVCCWKVSSISRTSTEKLTTKKWVADCGNRHLR